MGSSCRVSGAKFTGSSGACLGVLRWSHLQRVAATNCVPGMVRRAQRSGNPFRRAGSDNIVEGNISWIVLLPVTASTGRTKPWGLRSNPAGAAPRVGDCFRAGPDYCLMSPVLSGYIRSTVSPSFNQYRARRVLLISEGRARGSVPEAGAGRPAEDSGVKGRVVVGSRARWMGGRRVPPDVQSSVLRRSRTLLGCSKIGIPSPKRRGTKTRSSISPLVKRDVLFRRVEPGRAA